ncbi:hypothetical protein IAE38_000762 [Pseudomonas sp. S32]|nr:hypothetical protein [Pseudomonas sp. S32]
MYFGEDLRNDILPRRPADNDPSWIRLPKSFMLKQPDVPGLLVLEKPPLPRRLSQLKHVGQISSIDFATAVRCVRHLGKHGCAPVRVTDKRVSVVQLGYPGWWKIIGHGTPVLYI